MSTQTITARVITLYATKGAKKIKLETEALTWGELKSLIKNEGYDLDNLHATENINKTDLVNDLAVLPTGDFTVFMRPKQVKSGNRGTGLSYREIKFAIKNDFISFREAADTHYNQEKNYTVKSTEILRDLLNSFIAPSDVTTEKIKIVIETFSTPVKTITNAGRVEQIEILLKEICDNTRDINVYGRVSEILDEYLPGLKEEVENEDITLKEEELTINKEEKEEDDRLAVEAKMFE